MIKELISDTEMNDTHSRDFFVKRIDGGRSDFELYLNNSLLETTTDRLF